MSSKPRQRGREGVWAVGHVFFTGDIQVGKSTALRETVRQLGCRCGGFQTVFARRGTGEARLHLCPWGDGRCLPERTVAAFSPGKGMKPLPGAFDRLGPPLLVPGPGTELLVLDELGYLEQEAEGFRRAVFAALDGDTPCLGVLRGGLPGWLSDIAARADVTVLSVTKENRDAIPAAAAARLRNSGERARECCNPEAFGV